MNKGYKFRLYPNQAQEELIAKTFGCSRFIYNKMLEDKINHYHETGKTLSNTPAQYKPEFEWLKEVDSSALANVQINLQKAFKNFFNNKSSGFPKFKSKRRSKKSYTTSWTNNNIRIEDGFIILPKLGKVKIKQHRFIPESYKLKSCTISQTSSGKYYVSILFEYNEEIEARAIDTVIGLDFSMKELYVDSEGGYPEYPHYYRKALVKLKRMQRRLSKMTKYSSNYNKQRLKIANIHEHIANQRKDFLHKESRKIANSCDCVGIEDLDMKAMQQALNFGKSVSDNGWGMFVAFLDYKLTDLGKKLIKIDKWFPSSKTCSVCGNKKDELSLSERTYICECGNILDRDINAAINIKNEAIRMLSIA